jgi:hypothetical protein
MFYCTVSVTPPLEHPFQFKNHPLSAVHNWLFNISAVNLYISMATMTEVFPCSFLSCKANARVKPANTGHGPHSSYFLCCSIYCWFCVVLCIVCVYMCTVLLPPGGYPIAVKYIIYYIILYIYIYISPKAVSSIHNLKTLQTVVTGAHLTRKPTQFSILDLVHFKLPTHLTL